jgi:hypothetical protein
MDIKKAEEELTQVDSFLTKLKGVLKKHWGIILIILFCAFIYYVWKMPDPVETTINSPNVPTEEVVGTDVDGTENTDAEEFYQTGDTIWYDDGSYEISE